MSNHAPPRRLTPAESDALVAHMTPYERRLRIRAFIDAMAIRGIEVREVFDAAGRSYLMVDREQVEQVSAELAALFQEFAAQSPLPQGHTPPAA